MSYPSVTIQTAAAELNRLHGEIERKLRSTVEDAIRAGEILSSVKEKIQHGEFLPWIEAHCAFSERTARNYIRLFRHRDKTASVADLQAAYQQIETIERQQRVEEERAARDRIRTYEETGDKPDGWRRGTDDRLLEEKQADAQAFEERVRKIEDEDAQRRAAKERSEAERLETRRMLDEAAARLAAEEMRRQAFKHRLSQAGAHEPYIDAILDYLDELEDDNRRLEACHDIIKICKQMAIELQQRTAS